MPYQLNVICRRPDKPEWGFWFTRFWAEMPVGLNRDNCDGLLSPLYSFMLGLHKQCIQVDGIQWLLVGAETSPGMNGIATYPNEGHGGTNPMTADVKYKHNLQCAYEIPIGRHPHQQFRGCLDLNDINIFEKNQIGLKMSHSTRVAIGDFQSEVYGPFWRYLITRPPMAGGTKITSGSHPSKMWNWRAVNAHAITRIRNSVEGKGVEMGHVLLHACLSLENGYRRAKAQVDMDGAYTFGSIFIELDGLLTTFVRTHEAIKNYFEDADENSENGSEPPRSRFGSTGESIIGAWKVTSDSARKSLEELPVVNHPTQVDNSGELFMRVEHSTPWLDAIKTNLDKVLFSCYFDAFNLFAFEGQKPKQAMANAPEVVKLAL